MAKDGESTPDLPLKSEEESGEEETSSEENDNAEEKDNAAGSETESESESEPESKQTDNAQPIKKPPSTPVPDAKNPKSQTSDSSSEESESESESGPTIKPILSKPVDGDAQKAPALTKPKSKPNTASLSSTSKRRNPAGGAKRPATSETGGDGEVSETKRSNKKLKKEIQESGKKSSLNKESRKFARRLFSEEDEIAILKGMADFSANKKADPFTNLDVFHEFIKDSIHVDVSKAQLQDKIRKLRMKYLNNAQNEKQGKRKIIINDHERKAFELSKKVWGNETVSSAGRTIASPKINGDSVKRSSSKNVKSKKAVIDVGDEIDKGGNNLDGTSNGLERLKSANLGSQKLGTEEWVMQNSIQLVDGERRAEMDDKWRRFRTEEAELHCKRLELLLEEAKLLVDALRSSRD